MDFWSYEDFFYWKNRKEYFREYSEWVRLSGQRVKGRGGDVGPVCPTSFSLILSHASSLPFLSLLSRSSLSRPSGAAAGTARCGGRAARAVVGGGAQAHGQGGGVVVASWWRQGGAVGYLYSLLWFRRRVWQRERPPLLWLFLLLHPQLSLLLPTPPTLLGRRGGAVPSANCGDYEYAVAARHGHLTSYSDLL